MVNASWSLDVVIGHDLETKLNEKYIYLLVFYSLSSFQDIVKWGKEQPKTTNLALTPQP